MIGRAVEVCVVGVFFNNCLIVCRRSFGFRVYCYRASSLCVDEPNQTAMTLLDLSFLGIKKGIDLLTTDTILPFVKYYKAEVYMQFYVIIISRTEIIIFVSV